MLLYFCLALLILVIIGLVWLVNPKLSPIPYFPTLEKDMSRIAKALNLKSGSVLYDLGAGDGKIVFRMASSKIKAVAIESNPYLILLMQIRKLFHPHKHQVSVIWQDLFQADLKSATAIYLFVGPFLIDQIVNNILSKPHQKLEKIVSYRYTPKIKGFVKFDNLDFPIYVLDFKTKSARP